MVVSQHEVYKEDWRAPVEGFESEKTTKSGMFMSSLLIREFYQG